MTGKHQLIHITEDQNEKCTIKNTAIDNSNWYATGGIFDNQIFICGGTPTKATLPPTSKCEVFPAEAGNAVSVCIKACS